MATENNGTTEPGVGTPNPEPAKPTPPAKVYSETEFNEVAARERAANGELEQLRAWKADQEKAAKTREEQEAAQRGEYKQLHETEKTAHELTKKDYEAKLTAERERFKLARIKETVNSAYAAARGTSPALFDRVVGDFIIDGTIKVDDAGKVSGHLDAIKKIAEAHPQLFHNASKDAVDKALADIAGGVAGAAAGFAEKDKQVKVRRAPFSVAEAHATAAPPPNWRIQK